VDAPQRLLIVAPNWLGDAVMALPAIADVARHFPSAHLIVAARGPVAGMLRLAPCVHEVVTLQWRGRILRPAGWRHDQAALRKASCDTALLLPNSFAAAWLARRAAVRSVWGYATDLRRPLLTRAVAVPGRSVHQAEYYQHLVRALGVATGPAEAVLEVPRHAVEAARRMLVDRGWDGVRPLVAIAPGAAYGTAKQWVPAHFSALIGMLGRERDAQCVLVGSAADAGSTAAVRTGLKEAAIPVIDLAGLTTLETLAGIMRLSRVCVSNDSGAMHLAGAVGTPLAALFGPTREYETAPLTRQGSRSEVLINPVACRPCMLRHCPIDHRCMTGLAPERVFVAVSDLMGGRAGRVQPSGDPVR
jgi:heptosyltransferase-2